MRIDTTILHSGQGGPFKGDSNTILHCDICVSVAPNQLCRTAVPSIVITQFPGKHEITTRKVLKHPPGIFRGSIYPQGSQQFHFGITLQKYEPPKLKGITLGPMGTLPHREANLGTVSLATIFYVKDVRLKCIVCHPKPKTWIRTLLLTPKP